MMKSPASIPRVKERDDADRCRFCGRPTWSLRRCCVRCKRMGRSGRGMVPSLYARRGGPRLGFAFVCYWLGHVAVSIIAAHLIAGGIGAVAVVLSFGLASYLLHTGEPTLCETCGFDLTVEAEPICPDCGR